MRKFILVLSLFLLAIPALSWSAPPGFMKARMGTLSGQVITDSGEPVKGGVVSFFDTKKGIPPLYGNMHRIPDMVGSLRPDGSFAVKLLPGSYYLGALHITDPKRSPGPPKEGEKFYFAKDSAGNLLEISIKTQEQKDAGKIAVAEPDSFPLVKHLFTVNGRLLYEDGKPFVGGVVLVKTDMDKARPDFVSAQTNDKGEFMLQLPPDQEYYLLGRERSVGHPVPGSYIGTYGSTTPIAQGGALPIGNLRPSQPASGMPQVEGVELGPGSDLPKTVTGKAGDKLTGIDITMFKMPVPGEQREKLQGTLGFGDKFLKEQNATEQVAPGPPQK